MVWEVVERKVVAGVGITEEEGVPVPGPTPPEIPPITPAPPPGIGLKPAEIKAPEGFIEEHKVIKKYIDKKGFKYACVTPLEIEEATGLSLETIELHLEILQLDEAAKYIHKGDNPMVCSIDALQRLVENLRKLKT